MRHRTAAWSNVEPSEARVTVEDVELLGDQIRISGETDPPWVGPVDEARVSIDNRDQVVRAVEYGIAGYFALELDGELSHGDHDPGEPGGRLGGHRSVRSLKAPRPSCGLGRPHRRYRRRSANRSVAATTSTPTTSMSHGRYGASPWAIDVAMHLPLPAPFGPISQTTVDCASVNAQQPMTNTPISHSFTRSPPVAPLFAMRASLWRIGRSSTSPLRASSGSPIGPRVPVFWLVHERGHC